MPPCPRDRGSTFIEILVSVVLIGTAGVAVLTAVATAATGAATNRQLADVQSSLASAADVVSIADDENDSYVACARPSDYAELVGEFGVAVAQVEYWTGDRWSADRADCAFDLGERLQRVTLEASAEGVTRTLAAIKRPADEPEADLGPMATSTSGSSELGATDPTPTPGITGPTGGDSGDDGDGRDDEGDGDEDRGNGRGGRDGRDD